MVYIFYLSQRVVQDGQSGLVVWLHIPQGLRLLLSFFFGFCPLGNSRFLIGTGAPGFNSDNRKQEIVGRKGPKTYLSAELTPFLEVPHITST